MFAQNEYPSVTYFFAPGAEGRDSTGDIVWLPGEVEKTLSVSVAWAVEGGVPGLAE